MRSRFSAAGVLLQMSFRNLFASRVKTLMIGGIVLFGALLVVVGGSILDSVDAGMRRSVQGSLGGHIQVFNKASRDNLALYGGMMGDSDLTPVESFAPLKKALLAVPNVKMVVPMGIHDAIIAATGELDNALAGLRAAVRKTMDRDRSPADLEVLAVEKAHVRHMIALQKDEVDKTDAVIGAGAFDARDRADLTRAASDAFWSSFDNDPLSALEFLDNRIAPQAVEGGLIYLRYAGTDLDAFQAAFDRMHIIEGTPVPKGRRGILLAKFYAEQMLKLKTARRLDKIKEAVDHGRRIAKDPELQRLVKDNLSQQRDLLAQLGPIKEPTAIARLQQALGSSKAALVDLLTELLATNDGNFRAHYGIFYRELAPLLKLYAVNIGDTLTIKAFTQAGYMKAVNVKVYGIFEFTGLERSAFAGNTCLVDLMSFRDLYGYLTRERAAEIAALKREAGVRDVRREDVEAELFGTTGGLVASAKSEAFNESALLAPRVTPSDDDLFGRIYSPEEIDDGVVLNAAVILNDPSPPRIQQAIHDIQIATAKAGLDIKAITWQAASGMVGQFVTFSRFILYVVVFIIFAVALVIINNAMLMAMLQRVTEIGTVRAIGAQRRFVLLMVLVEGAAVGLAFGALGAALGAGVVGLVRALGGIPATSDQLYFFFSGPTLSPTLGSTNLVIALVIVLAVSILSGLYPAVVAMRITPLQAMQTEE